MNIAICDDEPRYIQMIQKYVDFYFKNKSIGYRVHTFSDGESALRCDTVFDIAFLDVEMGEYSGLKVGKEMKKRNRDIIFFVVTDYTKYLDDALDLNVLRFLKKPIDAMRLYSGLDHAMERMNTNNMFFYLRSEEETFRKIYMRNIVMVETDRRKTKLYTDDAVYESREKLSFWQKKLTPSIFVIPHNSYIINLEKITEFSRTELVLQGKDKYRVAIASKRQADFKRTITAYLESRR